MARLNEEHHGFLCEKFVNEVLDIGVKDPFGQRLKNVASLEELGPYFGIGSLASDPYKMRKGMMSEKLYNALAEKIGKERLDGYFDQSGEQMKKEDEWEQMATFLLGSVDEVNALRSRLDRK